MTDLSAQSVTYAYPSGVHALSGVSLALGPGELVCVLGPNGAGKSTLLKLMAGLLVPSEGSVVLGDDKLAQISPRLRARRVGVVPQWLARIPDVRVHDFVLGGRYGHLDRWRRADHSDHAAVSAALESADVGNLKERTLATLSGGQRRRVLVARALAQEAGFLLVDEPTSELDPEHQLAVFGLLRQLAEAGRGVLIVTHDLNLASQFASRVVLLSAGRTVRQGEVKDVLQPEVLSSIYSAPFRFGFWSTPQLGERPFAVPWESGKEG